MASKSARVVALAAVAALVLAAWQLGAATGGNQQKAGKVVLPPAAAEAIKKAFPKAAVGQAEREKEGVLLYGVALKQDGKEFEVEVTADGQIAEVERKVTNADLPQAVAKTLAKLTGDAPVKELARTETHAAVRLVKLRKAQVAYEAEFTRNGKTVEVTIAENGRVLSTEADDEDDDDDDDGREVTLEQVPAAVKAAILKEAGQNKIKEIELHARGDVKTYEAEWVADGKEVEIEVSSDGKLLGRSVEEEDDDD